MKIINSDSAYVQKNDIAYLNSSNLSIPASIFMKVYDSEITIIDDRNRYDFVQFDREKEIEFFKGIDWMLDYDEVKDLSEKEIEEQLMSVVEELNGIATRYNSMSAKEKQQHSDLIQKHKLIEFKYYSLIDFLLFMKGELSIELPDGVDYPGGMSKGGFGK